MKITKDFNNNWDKFLANQPSVTFEKGQTILLQDTAPTHLFIIKTGVVKAYDITNNGDEQPVSFATKNELFPIAWVFHHVEKTQYFYQAFTKVTAYKVTREEYRDFLQSHPDTMFNVYSILSGHFVSLQQRIHAVQQPKATDKILYTLMYMSDRFGTKVNPVTAKLKIPITQQELALFVGLTRETISVELKKLETAGVVSYSRSHFNINTKKLKKRLS